MLEQVLLRDKFVAFTSDWGLKSNYIADKLGISPGMLYQFRRGKISLTKTQAHKLEQFMADYERRMEMNLETYTLGTFCRIRDAVKDGEYDKAVQICTHGISYIKDLSAKVETNSASDNDVEIY